METQRSNKPRLLTVSQFAVEHPAFSQSSLRHLIFDASINGFSKVIRRIGKRELLLDEEAFFNGWMNSKI